MKRFDSDPQSMHHVRCFVEAVLDKEKLTPLVYVAQMLASELGSNAILHGCGLHLRVHITSLNGMLLIGVENRSTKETPALREAADFDEDGRGLLLVEKLAQRWGYTLLVEEGAPRSDGSFSLLTWFAMDTCAVPELNHTPQDWTISNEEIVARLVGFRGTVPVPAIATV